MIYYKDVRDESCGKKITLEEFKEIFKDWNGGFVFLSLEEFEANFDKLHCTVDPYHEELNSIIVPIVEYSHEELFDEWYESCRDV